VSLIIFVIKFYYDSGSGSGSVIYYGSKSGSPTEKSYSGCYGSGSVTLPIGTEPWS
jgi:hypothetical protein